MPWVSSPICPGWPAGCPPRSQFCFGLWKGRPYRAQWKRPGDPPNPPSPPPHCRHLKEISELQSQQKQEIEALYRRLGKTLPPNLGLLHTAPPTGRRRKTSRSKLKAGRLLTPLVQQLKVVASSTGRPCALLAALAGGWAGSWAGGRWCPDLEEHFVTLLSWEGEPPIAAVEG